MFPQDTVQFSEVVLLQTVVEFSHIVVEFSQAVSLSQRVMVVFSHHVVLSHNVTVVLSQDINVLLEHKLSL